MARRLALGLAALALLAAGCGGNGDGNGNGAENGDGAGTAPPGADVFASAGCGSCHTLEEAGTSGTIGPALDGANLTADQVAEQVRNGGGGMPAFADQLSEDEIQNVAAFVAEASQS